MNPAALGNTHQKVHVLEALANSRLSYLTLFSLVAGWKLRCSFFIFVTDELLVNKCVEVIALGIARINYTLRKLPVAARGRDKGEQGLFFAH